MFNKTIKDLLGLERILRPAAGRVILEGEKEPAEIGAFHKIIPIVE